MIYEDVDLTAPIRQGDIFFNLPKLDFSMDEVLFEDQRDDLGSRCVSWNELIQKYSPQKIADDIQVSVPVKCVPAIVATQDCDALRSPDITLCEIRRFVDVERSSQNVTSLNRFVQAITRQARLNLKWFYLPPNEEIGFKERMAVDFLATLRLQREELEKFSFLRKKRLNIVADEHFRERIGEFFRRYPYDEWYPLSKEELALYNKDHCQEPSPPFPWQK
jgi:hypothetical protein